MRLPQTILRGAEMKQQPFNAAFNAAARRSYWGTMMGNAENRLDPKKQIPLYDGNPSIPTSNRTRQLSMESRVLRVHGAKKNLNAPWREVPIRNSLVPVFAEWRKRDLRAGISHIVHYKGRPIQSIKTAWRATLKRAGISRKIRPYDLRHAFGTEMVAAGVDVGTVAKLMGHSTPIMLLNHYQYVMDQQKRAAVEAMPDVPHVSK